MFDGGKFRRWGMVTIAHSIKEINNNEVDTSTIKVINTVVHHLTDM